MSPCHGLDRIRIRIRNCEKLAARSQHSSHFELQVTTCLVCDLEDDVGYMPIVTIQKGHESVVDAVFPEFL